MVEIYVDNIDLIVTQPEFTTAKDVQKDSDLRPGHGQLISMLPVVPSLQRRASGYLLDILGSRRNGDMLLSQICN